MERASCGGWTWIAEEIVLEMARPAAVPKRLASALRMSLRRTIALSRGGGTQRVHRI
jgi:hypothetical protein